MSLSVGDMAENVDSVFMQRAVRFIAFVLAFGLASYASRSCRDSGWDSIEIDQQEIEEGIRQQGIPQVDAHRIAVRLKQSLAPVYEDPRFVELLRARVEPHASSGAEAHQLGRQVGAELVARGVPHLEDDDLLEIGRLRLRLAQANDQVCAGLWTGNVADYDLYLALASLSDDEIASWFDVSAKATVTQLGSPPPAGLPPNQRVVSDGFEFAANQLSPTEQQRFWQTMSQGAQARPRDGCAVMLATLSAAEQMDRDRRVRFLRQVAIMTVPEEAQAPH